MMYGKVHEIWTFHGGNQNLLEVGSLLCPFLLKYAICIYLHCISTMYSLMYNFISWKLEHSCMFSITVPHFLEVKNSFCFICFKFFKYIIHNVEFKKMKKENKFKYTSQLKLQNIK